MYVYLSIRKAVTKQTRFFRVSALFCCLLTLTHFIRVGNYNIKKSDNHGLLFIFYGIQTRMATAADRARCIKCGSGKDRATTKCGGCMEDFCRPHMKDHQQELDKQLEEIEMNRDLFREALTQQSQKPDNRTYIQQIDQWEKKSIKIIQETAHQARQTVLQGTNEHTGELETKLNKLTNRLRESREEDNFNEIDLRQFQEQLDKLTEELQRPSTISIREDSTSFITKIHVEVSSKCSLSILTAAISDTFDLWKL